MAGVEGLSWSRREVGGMGVAELDGKSVTEVDGRGGM